MRQRVFGFLFLGVLSFSRSVFADGEDAKFLKAMFSSNPQERIDALNARLEERTSDYDKKQDLPYKENLSYPKFKLSVPYAEALPILKEAIQLPVLSAGQYDPRPKWAADILKTMHRTMTSKPDAAGVSHEQIAEVSRLLDQYSSNMIDAAIQMKPTGPSFWNVGYSDHPGLQTQQALDWAIQASAAIQTSKSPELQRKVFQIVRDSDLVRKLSTTQTQTRTAAQLLELFDGKTAFGPLGIFGVNYIVTHTPSSEWMRQDLWASNTDTPAERYYNLFKTRLTKLPDEFFKAPGADKLSAAQLREFLEIPTTLNDLEGDNIHHRESFTIARQFLKAALPQALAQAKTQADWLTIASFDPFNYSTESHGVRWLEVKKYAEGFFALPGEPSADQLFRLVGQGILEFRGADAVWVNGQDRAEKVQQLREKVNAEKSLAGKLLTLMEDYRQAGGRDKYDPKANKYQWKKGYIRYDEREAWRSVIYAALEQDGSISAVDYDRIKKQFPDVRVNFKFDLAPVGSRDAARVRDKSILPIIIPATFPRRCAYVLGFLR